MRTRIGPDEVEVGFRQLVAETASVHHYGLTDPVDHRIRNSIKVRYPARRLLGFNAHDRDDIMATVLGALED
jgi:phage gpG-like protein